MRGSEREAVALKTARLFFVFTKIWGQEKPEEANPRMQSVAGRGSNKMAATHHLCLFVCDFREAGVGKLTFAP